MAESGEGEEMLTHAVRANRGSGGVKSGAAQQKQQQLGLAQTAVSLEEARARRDAVAQVEEGLLALHQIFLDMATLVEQQGEMLDNIEVGL